MHTLQGGEWEEVDKRCDSIDEVLRIGSMHELVSMNYKLYVLFCLRMFEVSLLFVLLPSAISHP